MPELRIRQAVRALLLTPGNEVLLVRFEFAVGMRWALPGGGLDPGEDHLSALRRELIEETGLTDPVIGPHVWTREHVIPFENGLWDGQRELVHLVPTARFEPRPTLSWAALHSEHVHELRWWTLDEIESADGVHFAPARLPELVRSIASTGPPPVPIDSGV